jgi:hypothetical protein
MRSNKTEKGDMNGKKVLHGVRRADTARHRGVPQLRAACCAEQSAAKQEYQKTAEIQTEKEKSAEFSRTRARTRLCRA